MITDRIQIANMIQECLSEAFENGLITADDPSHLTMDMLYRFSLTDVLSIYTHKITKEEGVWFQLRDGSIWNKSGQLEENSSCLSYQ
jgi:hypothetical protein